MNINRLIDSNSQIYLELKLLLNKELYDEKIIPFSLFKISEEILLKSSKE